MGLDMYLTKKIYIGANYEHNKVTGTIELFSNGKLIGINLEKIVDINERTAYWRKSNQIHKWFVDNVQEGEDNCAEYYVSDDNLKDLVNLCKKAIETQDASLLPPQSGFFYGSTDIDEYYWGDLQSTIDQLENLDPDGSYYYSSSW